MDQTQAAQLESLRPRAHSSAQLCLGGSTTSRHENKEGVRRIKQGECLAGHGKIMITGQTKPVGSYTREAEINVGLGTRPEV